MVVGSSSMQITMLQAKKIHSISVSRREVDKYMNTTASTGWDTQEQGSRNGPLQFSTVTETTLHYHWISLTEEKLHKIQICT